MYSIRLINQIPKVRLCASQSKAYLPILCSDNRFSDNDKCFRTHKRHFSWKENIDSLARTQSGVFQSISESAPVGHLQQFLHSVHDFSGLPWWATIICSTVIIRSTITVPLAVYQHYIMAKLENIKLEMPQIVAELKRETAMAIKMYKWDEKTARITYNRSVRKQWNNLIVRENCHPFKASLLIWFQIPLWISFSVALRNLVYMLPENTVQAKLTLTELSLGGFGWIPNLTVPDTSLILPVALGVINLAIIELQTLSRQNDPSRFQKVLTNIFRGFSILMVPIAASVPSCLVLYWTTSSACGLVQNLVLMSPKVKRLCKIPPTQSELLQPYAYIVNKAKSKLKLQPQV